MKDMVLFRMNTWTFQKRTTLEKKRHNMLSAQFSLVLTKNDVFWHKHCWFLVKDNFYLSSVKYCLFSFVMQYRGKMQSYVYFSEESDPEVLPFGGRLWHRNVYSNKVSVCLSVHRYTHRQIYTHIFLLLISRKGELQGYIQTNTFELIVLHSEVLVCMVHVGIFQLGSIVNLCKSETIDCKYTTISEFSFVCFTSYFIG